MRFGTNNLERMILTNTGRLGMGTSSPVAPLHINTSVSRTVGAYAYVTPNATTPTGWHSTTSNTANYAAVFNGRVEVQDELNVTSDVRTKKIIAHKQNALDQIMQLNIVDYSKYSDMNKETGFGIVTTGILAQELEKIDGLKHTVLQSEGNFINKNFENETVQDLRTVNDKSIFYTGIAAIQELNEQLDYLKTENKKLKDEHIVLNQKLERLDTLSAKVTKIQELLSNSTSQHLEENSQEENNK